jgi:hypothetical protein
VEYKIGKLQSKMETLAGAFSDMVKETQERTYDWLHMDEFKRTRSSPKKLNLHRQITQDRKMTMVNGLQVKPTLEKL